MHATSHGSFAIGFRRGWSPWQRDLPALFAWTKAHGFAFIDFGNDGDQAVPQAQAAGVEVGSVDLPCWKELLSPETGERREAVARASDYVKACGSLGIRTFMTILLPTDPARPRRENLALAVESYGALAPVLESCGASIAIEGWPGPGALGCTPESLRAFFAAVPSEAMGINYDPSHLIRMGIDPLRFIGEFGPRIRHVHAKDTELFPERLYDFGHEQPATLERPRGFGSHVWRYAIPGRGVAPWREILSRLADGGFRGRVSIELEDDEFNGTEEGEQRGLLLAREALRSA
jgi:sugar phosphate isomerase/epimerase